MGREGDNLGLVIAVVLPFVVGPIVLYGGQGVELGKGDRGTQFRMIVETGVGLRGFPDIRQVGNEAEVDAYNSHPETGRELVDSFRVINAISGQRVDDLSSGRQVIDLDEIGNSPIAFVATIDGRREFSKTYTFAVNEDGDLEYEVYQGETPALPSGERQNGASRSTGDSLGL